MTDISDLKGDKKCQCKKFKHWKEIQETAQIKVGDIIGNTVKGFDWKVLKVLPDGGFEVKNLDTGEKKSHHLPQSN